MALSFENIYQQFAAKEKTLASRTSHELAKIIAILKS